MANSNIAQLRPVKQAAGLWLVDAVTTRTFDLEPGNGGALIAEGQTVAVLMDGATTKLDCSIAILMQMANDLTQAEDPSRAEVLDGVVTLLRQANGMSSAAYETLLETAITLGQS